MKANMEKQFVVNTGKMEPCKQAHSCLPSIPHIPSRGICSSAGAIRHDLQDPDDFPGMVSHNLCPRNAPLDLQRNIPGLIVDHSVRETSAASAGRTTKLIRRHQYYGWRKRPKRNNSGP